MGMSTHAKPRLRRLLIINFFEVSNSLIALNSKYADKQVSFLSPGYYTIAQDICRMYRTSEEFVNLIVMLPYSFAKLRSKSSFTVSSYE